MRYLNYILFFLLCWACRPGNNTERQGHDTVQKKKLYTCPMHPGIIRDAPGLCPICGMALVEKTSVGAQGLDTSVEFLLKPTNRYVLSQVKTVRMEKKEVPVEFTATGNITYDTRMINTVAARVNGRIEKLYVKYKFQEVKKGDKLMDIYSKELLTEQENYLFLLNNDADNNSILTAAEKKLELEGLTKAQISYLKKTKKARESVTIYSPYSGHLHDFTSMSTSGDGMGNQRAATGQLSVHEGMYVQRGQTVFNIYSTDKVWAVLNVHIDRLEILRKGQTVKLIVDGVTEPIIATIDFIEPQLRKDQKTAAVRVYLNNTKGTLKIGAIVKAEVQDGKVKGYFLPDEAVLSLGLNKVAFVLRDKLFEARKVKTGIRTNGLIEILDGLVVSDMVAGNAQLLMDSEAFVRFSQQK